MYKFREMLVTDIPAAFRVRTSTIENALTMQELTEDFELTPETLTESLKTSAKGWVCECEDEVVGFAMGDSAEHELTVLAVLPHYEGNGIGKRLLTEVESWLFSLGGDEIWLVTAPNSSLRAYGLYVSQGWIPTGEILGEDEKFVKLRSR